MGKIIEFNKKHVNKEYIDQLYKEMADITGDAEMIETEDGEILLDAVSELKISAIEMKINLELLKGGYSMEEVYG